MKKKIMNHGVQEGLLFLILGGVLIWYSLDAYGKSYIKDWAQSPSLFPLLTGVLLGVLALCVLIRGLRESDDMQKKGGQAGRVLVLLGISLAYYLALAVIRLPYMALTLFSLNFTFSTFELATLVFLFAMMLYLGVRKVPLLVGVPVGVTLFLSVVFRTLLRVLLP